VSACEHMHLFSRRIEGESEPWTVSNGAHMCLQQCMMQCAASPAELAT
jgi:hypothetical protein